MRSAIAEKPLAVTCEFCGATLPVLAQWEEVVIPETCRCAEAVAKREAADLLFRGKEEREQAERARRFTNSIRSMFGEMPEKFRDATFENYNVLPFNKTAFETAREYSQNLIDQPCSMLFTGTVGTGKSHLAASICNQQILRGRSVLFGTVPDLLSRIKSTYSDDHESEQEVMSVFYRCSLLVMDDLGKEKVGPWVEEKVYSIINARYERNLPIVITTNVGLKAVKELYPTNGAAIVSRLYEMCPRGIMLNGPDYRMTKGRA